MHHDEDEVKRRRRRDALDALHFSRVDGSYFENTAVWEEFKRLQAWWRRACTAVRSSRPDPVLKDEAEAAMEWCIALAQELIEAERNARTGRPETHSELKATRDWVWERFANLERGLMSNGVKRR